MKGFVLDSNGDITNGIGEITTQAIGLLVESTKGERKNHPGAGVDLFALVNSSERNIFFEIEKRIRLELEVDGAKVERIELVNGKLLVGANWGEPRERVSVQQNNIAVLPQPLEVVAQKGQTLFDIAIQYMGSDLLVVELAKENDLSITSELAPGQVLKVHKVVNQSMVDYLKNKGVTPISI